MAFELDLKTALTALGALLCGWAIAAFFFRTRILRQSGRVFVDNGLPRDYDIHYPIEYAKPPKIELAKDGDDQDVWTADVTGQRGTGFTVNVTKVSTLAKRNNYLIWMVEGVPQEEADPRSRWSRLPQIEKIFALASLAGVIAVAWLFGPDFLAARGG